MTVDSKINCSKCKFVPGATTILATLPTSPFKMVYEKQNNNVKFRALSETGQWFHKKRHEVLRDIKNTN